MFKNSLKKIALYPMEIVNNCQSLHYQATISDRLKKVLKNSHIFFCCTGKRNEISVSNKRHFIQI